MIPTIRNCTAVILAVAIALLVWGCSRGSGENSVNLEYSQIRIGLLMSKSWNPRWEYHAKNMGNEALAQNVDLVFRESSQGKQEFAKATSDMLNAGAKVIIVATRDADSMLAAVEVTRQASVPLIIYEYLAVPSPGASLFVSYDQDAVGRTLAEGLLTQQAGKTYLLLPDSSKDRASVDCERGIASSFSELNQGLGIKLLSSKPVNFAKNDQVAAVLAPLLRRNKIDGIFLAQDSAVPVVAAELARMRKSIPIAAPGMENATMLRILSRLQSLTVFEDPRQLGKEAVKAAVRLAQGSSVESIATGSYRADNIEIPVVFLDQVLAVNRDNIAQTKSDTDYFDQ